MSDPEIPDDQPKPADPPPEPSVPPTPGDLPTEPPPPPSWGASASDQPATSQFATPEDAPPEPGAIPPPPGFSPLESEGAGPPEPPGSPPYPVSFDVEPIEKLSRLSTFFRIILAIPLLIVVSIAGAASVGGSGLLAGLIGLHWITVIVRGRPVGWIFAAIVHTQRFTLRATTYFLLITDKYPPFDGEWAASYDVQRPEKLSRWKILIWKTIAIIPHGIILGVLGFAVAVCVVIAWFAILFTGRYPLGLRNFVIGWIRWYARVGAYWMSLRDDFPPYSLSAEAPAASRSVHGVSALAGGAVVAASIAGLAAFLILAPTSESVDVDYAALLNGEPTEEIEVGNATIVLPVAADPFEFADQIWIAEEDERFVAFLAQVTNDTGFDLELSESDFSLKDTGGDSKEPVFMSLDGLRPPRDLTDENTVTVILIFEIPADEDPETLSYERDDLRTAKFEFE